MEAKCKEAAALKLPLIGLDMNTAELHELFQVSNYCCMSHNVLMRDLIIYAAIKYVVHQAQTGSPLF